MSQTGLGRRTLVRGAAWAAPVIAVAATAPAYATSPPKRTTLGASMEWNNGSWDTLNHTHCPPSGWTPNSPLVLDGRRYTGDSLTGNPTVDYTAVFFTNDAGGPAGTTQVCNLTFTFYSPVRTTWIALTSSDADWSVPTEIGTTTYNSRTYYIYRSTFKGGACFQLQDEAVKGYQDWWAIYYGWRSSTCYSSRPGSNFRVMTSSTINGVAVSRDGGWAPLG